MAAQYQYSILVSQAPLSQPQSALAAIKKSLLLVLGNPGFTIILFVVTLGFGVLCFISGVGMILLFAGSTAILQANAVKELYARYGIEKAPSQE
jgi:uncharacterized membrane protein YesL